MKLNTVVTMLLLCGMCWAQNPSLVLPDAPDPQPAPAKQRRQWSDVKFRSNGETLSNKSMWLFDFAAIAPGLLDAEVSHAGLAHHKCAEAHHLNSRWQLYRNNLPEWGVELAIGFLGTKVKMPRWLMFSVAAYPIEAHGRATARWLDGPCW